MKYITKENQQYIQKIFKENNFKIKNNSINGSTLKTLFKKYPDIKIIIKNILINQPKFEKLSFILKCILLDMDLQTCKICRHRTKLQTNYL